MNYDKLMKYTAIAELGLTLDKDTNLNYRYSLPNKLFDYLQAGIPVLSSNLPEIKRIIDNYKVGEIVYNHNPVSIASKIKQMLEEDYKSKLKENLAKASSELVWENEAYVLKEIMQNIENEK
jgi:glycosyltransferase involved in cell wall biosynthesis